MFICVCIINLKYRRDRLKSVLAQLSASDISYLPVYRMEAHVGKSLDASKLLTKTALFELASLQKSGMRSHHAQLTPGAIGCYLSHVDVWKLISSGPPLHPTLILEDDVTIPTAVRDRMTYGWKTASDLAGSMPFIVLYECICMSECDKQINGLYMPGLFWSLMSYAMHGKTAAALLAMDLLPLDVHLDSKLRYLRDSGKLLIFVYPTMINTGAQGTDINYNTINGAPFDRAS
jgi:hypothetical protein